MIKREQVVQIANDLLKKQKNPTLWNLLIQSYCDEVDSSKTDSILQKFVKLPDNIQIELVKVAFDYYSRKYTVCSVMKIEDDPFNTVIINGIKQEHKIIYNYY